MWLGAIAFLTGCNWVFSIHDVADAPPGIVDDVATAPCVEPPQRDAFDGPGICSSWGYPLSSDVVEEYVANSELVLLPDSKNPDDTGCVSSLQFPFTKTGTFVEISQVSTGPTQFDTFIVSTDPTMNEGATISDQLPDLVFAWQGAEQGRAHYDAIAMRWWRVRVGDDGASIVGEYGPDGRRWTTLGAVEVTPPPKVKVQLQSGTHVAGATTPFRIAGFDVCP